MALYVADVPIDAFWSVTLYDSERWIPINDLDAYSYNNITAEHNDDGTATINFGGDPTQPNYLPVVPGWSYIFRAYQPREEILDGSWSFPQAEGADPVTGEVPRPRTPWEPPNSHGHHLAIDPLQNGT